MALALRIGPYVVLDHAGRGGMGVVYHAVRDNDYRQEVAIKVVRAGAETDFLIARFHLERQALALLNHPNIARLLDGGATPDGWPYLVMEWVEGKPITEYCSAHGLGVRERLKLFLDICRCRGARAPEPGGAPRLEAIQYPHHFRGDPETARLRHRQDLLPRMQRRPAASLTAGTRLLTPEYASPEQLRGEVVTTATDVYSLGAVLVRNPDGHPAAEIRKPAAVDMNSNLRPGTARSERRQPARRCRRS